GWLGRLARAGVRKVGFHPLAFVENNAGLWGRAFDDLTVLSPDDAAREFGCSAAFVVTVFRPAQPQAQLRTLGCARVVPYAPLFWKYAEALLPFCFLDLPTEIFAQREAVRRAFDLWSDEASRREDRKSTRLNSS